jgi:hypothetical protein
MTSDRRDFLGRAAFGAASFTGLTSLADRLADELGITASGSAAPVDTSWTRRVRGKHRAVFDVAEIESALGVFRSQLWASQVQEAFTLKPEDVGIVLVLRHNAIGLAMQQAYWDKYEAGKANGATHPVTRQPTDRNPALLSSARGEIPERFDALALDKAIERGTIVLGCNLALEAAVVSRIARTDGVPTEEARKRAHELLVPGVIMQPSGIFGAVAAQEVGCRYVRAS